MSLKRAVWPSKQDATRSTMREGGRPSPIHGSAGRAETPGHIRQRVARAARRECLPLTWRALRVRGRSKAEQGARLSAPRVEEKKRGEARSSLFTPLASSGSSRGHSPEMREPRQTRGTQHNGPGSSQLQGGASASSKAPLPTGGSEAAPSGGAQASGRNLFRS